MTPPIKDLHKSFCVVRAAPEKTLEVWCPLLRCKKGWCVVYTFTRQGKKLYRFELPISDYTSTRPANGVDVTIGEINLVTMHGHTTRLTKELRAVIHSDRT